MKTREGKTISKAAQKRAMKEIRVNAPEFLFKANERTKQAMRLVNIALTERSTEQAATALSQLVDLISDERKADARRLTALCCMTLATLYFQDLTVFKGIVAKIREVRQRRAKERGQ